MKLRHFIAALILFSGACSGTKNGLTEVKTPFSGNRYESNPKWFRSTGSGESIDLETSRSKAMLLAKQRLASSVETNMKSVAENYAGERTAGETTADFNARFQSLTREVLNTVLVDASVFDQKTYQKQDKNYISYVAMEARKKTIYAKIKERATLQKSLSEKDKAEISKMIDKAIVDLDDKD